MKISKSIRIEYTIDGEHMVYLTTETAATGINLILGHSSGRNVIFKQLSIVENKTLGSGKVHQKNLYF